MRRALALLFTAAVLLAGCGDGGEEDTAPAATPTPEQEERGGYVY
jgi:hypothetical protein